MQLQYKLNYNLHSYTMMVFKWNASHNWNIRIRLIIFCLLLHLCYFGIWLTCFDLIHYKINNTFSDIVISKLAKFITSHVHVLLLNYIFLNTTTILFLKTPYLEACMYNFDFDGFEHYQRTLYNTPKKKKNNES
jgi:hypothetical protein